jgi:hypothetical protein
MPNNISSESCFFFYTYCVKWKPRMIHNIQYSFTRDNILKMEGVYETTNPLYLYKDDTRQII